MSTYDWVLLANAGKLFDESGVLTPEGRIAYLKGIIEKNCMDIRQIKSIMGLLPYPKRGKGMQFMGQEEWQKALQSAKEITITNGDDIVFSGNYRALIITLISELTNF